MHGIDFPWTAQEEAKWDRMYEKLVRFHTTHGHTRVPTKNAELYRWTNEQRKVLRSLDEEGNSRGGRIGKRVVALEKILTD